MSFSVSSSGGGRGKRRGGGRPMSDINVTPLVDVMLVLLVIFIVTAPMMTEKVKVDLPNTKGDKKPSAQTLNTEVFINAQGQVQIVGVPGAEKVLEPAEVQKILPQLLKDVDKKVITLKADKNLKYDKVMELMGILKQEGFNSVSLGVGGAK
jgi:biopolymer transport protein TolR